MGRGNACVSGEHETLFYIDYDNFINYICDDDGNPTEERDYDLESQQLNDDLDLLKSLLSRRLPVLDEPRTDYCYSTGKYRKEKRIGDCRILLESGLFYIGIEDNEWSAAIKLLQKEDVPVAFQAHAFESHKKALQDCLFELYNKLGIYGGPWTHGMIQRPEGWASNKKLWQAA